MAHQVFICYASRDKAVAEAVCDTLESKHIKCWIAPRDVLPGTEWAETIVDALDSSRLIVLVLSSSSNTSPQVRREVARAASKDIPIIPLRIDDVIPSKAMDYFVSGHHWLDAQTGPLERHLNRLADTVQQILSREGAPPKGIEKAEAEEKAREAKEKARLEAEEKARAEAEEARKAREAEEARKAEERARKEAEKAAKEKAKREAEETKRAEKAWEKAVKEAEKAKKAKGRRAKPAKVGVPLLKRWWLWTGAAVVLVALISLLVFLPRGTEELSPTLSDIAVTPASPADLDTGSTQQFTATGTYSDGSTSVLFSVDWNSDDPNVATIDSNGLATGVWAGTANITATLSGITSPSVSLTVVGAAPPPVEPYGTLTAAVADFGEESTDPVFSESLWGWAFYDSLLRWDENGYFIPGVAEDWEFDEATCTWTFYIREGITFHNGDPLTAHDVKFSVDRFGDTELSTNPWSFNISEAYNKVETRVVDDYTFQFVSDHPEPAQQIVFAWTRILPKNYYEEVGMDYFRAHPIGSGPWKFVELVSDTKMTLEANTDYWAEDEIPHYQYYVEYEVPEQATRISMLKSGEVDIAYNIGYDQLAGLEAEGFATESLGPPGTSSMCIQGSWLPGAGPTSDIRVRQAMSYALNRQEICDIWYSGYAVPGGQFYMYPGCFGWTDELANVDPYDPELAMSLLEAAGYPDAFADPTIHIYTESAGQGYHLLLMSYWQDVGLDVQLEVVDSTTWFNYFFNSTRIQEGDPNVGWIWTWTYQAFFNCTYHSANMYTSWGVHNTCNDPMADELYLKAAGELDPELAYQYFADLQKYVKTLYVNIGIVQFDILYVYNPNTVGEWAGRNWVSIYDALNGIQHK